MSKETSIQGKSLGGSVSISGICEHLWIPCEWENGEWEHDGDVHEFHKYGQPLLKEVICQKCLERKEINN